MTQLRAIRTFYTDRGKLLTLDGDVLGIVSQVRELFGGRISIQLDDDTGWFHLVEHCADQTDRLVFSTLDLDGRVIERLQQADSISRAYRDPYELQEREQDAEQKAIEATHREKIREHGEELAFALKKDGVSPRLPLQVNVPKDVTDA